MSASLQFTVYVSGDKRVVEAVVAPGSDIPDEIFLYENTEEGVGNFFATCSFSDFSRFRVDPGAPVPLFGNRYLRRPLARQFIDLDIDPEFVKNAWIEAAQKFRVEYLNQATPVVTVVNL